MEERFTNAAKIDVGNRVKRFQASQDVLEGFFAHRPDGLIPGIAEAGDAVQVAGHGWFDVDLGQVRDRAMHADEILAFIQADFCTRLSAHNLRPHPAEESGAHVHQLLPRQWLV